jgi:CheY-like chemotaxis protein
MQKARTILIIEDNEVVQAQTRAFIQTRYRTLGREVQVIQAPSAKQGLEFLRMHGLEFDIILLDGCLDGQEPDGLQMIPDIRALYSGPILAMSKSFELREMMLKAGATHQCEKSYAAGTAVSILEQQEIAA